MIRAHNEQGVLRLLIATDTLDALCAEDAKRVGFEQIDGNHPVVLDLAEVERIDSAGVGALISLIKHARREDQPACLISAGPEVMRVLRLIRLDAILEVQADFETAVETFRSRARQTVPR